LFDELDRVYRGASSLLRDADRMMAQHGYRVAHKNTGQVGLERSYKLDWPTWWYPGWVSRHYVLGKGKGARNVYVSVIFCKRPDDDYGPIEVPVVSAGVLELDSGVDWSYWMAKSWAWTPERSTDGTPVSLAYRTFSGARVRVLAHPLESIVDAAALEEKIIAPLCKLAGEESPANSSSSGESS
jgi:hypothetical protein